MEKHKQERFPYKYFVITFLWSWAIWIPLSLVSRGVIQIDKELLSVVILPLLIAGAFGPMVGAFYCLRTLQGKGAITQYLRGLLDFNLGWQAWILPMFLFGCITWFAWILPEFWGEPRLEMLLPSVWIFPPYVILIILLGGGQEELGWRGYILDPLEEKLGVWLGNIVLGAVWALWHLPLFFTPGAHQMFMPFAGFVLLMIGYSWFFSWIREVSGKRTLAGLVAHGWANAFVPLFPIIVMVEGVVQPRYWIWLSLTFLLGLVTMLLRSGKDKQTKMHDEAAI